MTTTPVEPTFMQTTSPTGAKSGDHTQTFDPAVQVPPARMLPFRTTRATPYLYTASEINALMDLSLIHI